LSVLKLDTSEDGDWWETSVFVDLPTNLPVGATNITITSTSGESYGPVPVQIVGGTGSPTAFSYEPGGALLIPEQFQSMERADHFVVSFNGTTIPYAIQVGFTHDPDESSGGTGQPHVINTRGDLKSINWSDDGTNMIVMLTPAKGQVLGNFLDYKFYVSGGITGLRNATVQAFDIDGDPVPGIVVSIE